jgi:hypothetical protein
MPEWKRYSLNLLVGAIDKVVNSESVSHVDRLRPGHSVYHWAKYDVWTNGGEIETRLVVVDKIPSCLLGKLFRDIVSEDRVLLLNRLGGSYLCGNQPGGFQEQTFCIFPLTGFQSFSVYEFPGFAGSS